MLFPPLFSLFICKALFYSIIISQGFFDHIFVYDGQTFSLVSTVNVSPSLSTPFALGSRWIAFSENGSIENVPKPNKGVFVSTVRTLAKSFYDVGTTVFNYESENKTNAPTISSSLPLAYALPYVLKSFFFSFLSLFLSSFLYL